MGELKSGDKAPAFSLVDQDGKSVKLSGFKGGKLLLYFYPKAGTSACTTQACCVRDAMAELKKLKTNVVGISPDQRGRLKKFDQRHGLGFPLLSDEDHGVAEQYGVWGGKSMYGKKCMGIIRSSFLIDEKGKIIDAWYSVKARETVPKATDALSR